MALQTGGGGRLCGWCMARRDACDLRAAEAAAATAAAVVEVVVAAAAVNVDCLHRWVQPFLLPRLAAYPSGRLGSAASRQIASVERG